MGSHSKGPQQESQLLTSAQTANTTAATADPMEQLERDRTERLYNWSTGKSGPIDIRNMPDDVGVPLYKTALMAHDEGRKGGGLALAENPNTNFTAALGKEAQLEKELQASAGLEEHVDDRMAALDDRLTGLGAMGNARRAGAADRATSLYSTFLNRPQRPGFLKQLALGAVGGLSSLGLGMMTGGGSMAAAGTAGKV